MANTMDVVVSEKQVIRVQESEYKGRTFVDVRKMYLTKEGEFAPTTKGIAIPIDKFQEVASRITTMAQAMKDSSK